MRHFDVDRTFVAETSLDATNDLGSGCMLIEQNGACNRDFVIDAPLCLESFHFVMQ